MSQSIAWLECGPEVRPWEEEAWGSCEGLAGFGTGEDTEGGSARGSAN